MTGAAGVITLSPVHSLESEEKNQPNCLINDNKNVLYIPALNRKFYSWFGLFWQPLNAANVGWWLMTRWSVTLRQGSGHRMYKVTWTSSSGPPVHSFVLPYVWLVLIQGATPWTLRRHSAQTLTGTVIRWRDWLLMLTYVRTYVLSVVLIRILTSDLRLTAALVEH